MDRDLLEVPEGGGSEMSDLKRLDEFVAELREKGGLNRPWGYSGHGCYDTVVQDLTVLVDYEDGIRVGVYANYPAEHDPIGWLEEPSVDEVKKMIHGLVKERAS